MISRISLRYIVVLLVLTLGLAACGNSSDDNRSFAPEIRGEDTVPTDTPPPTATIPGIDAQPNEGNTSDAATAELFGSTGPAQAVLAGLTTVALVTVDSGATVSTDVPNAQSTSSSVSPDGTRLITIDRSSGAPVVTMRLIGAEAGTPQPVATVEATSATPAAAISQIQLGDRIAWAPDNQHVVVAVAGAGVWLLDTAGNQTALSVASESAITAIAWSMSGQSVALGLWNNGSHSSVIATLSLQNPDASPVPILSLPESDGRYIRSMAWGTEQVGVLFALRSATGDMTVSNDLYSVRKLGEPMRLIASAGVAAPIAAIDQIALADNGTTVAFAVQVPGEVGLKFDSIWVTDVTGTGAVRANTSGLRRIAELEWTPRGLVVVGTRRVLDDGNGYVLNAVEIVSANAPVSITVDRSPATPVGSPEVSPASPTS